MRHTITVRAFLGFKSEVILASSSKDRRRLTMISGPYITTTYKVRYNNGTDQSSLFFDLESAIEFYNSI